MGQEARSILNCSCMMLQVTLLKAMVTGFLLQRQDQVIFFIQITQTLNAGVYYIAVGSFDFVDGSGLFNSTE